MKTYWLTLNLSGSPRVLFFCSMEMDRRAVITLRLSLLKESASIFNEESAICMIRLLKEHGFFFGVEETRP